jgi:hypothetical protein
VDGVHVDPHEILTYSAEIREKYFSKMKDRVSCFSGLNMTQMEMEQSLVLADISKPGIKKYKEQLMLGPIRVNEIATVMSLRIAEKIRRYSEGRINPPSFMVTIYDSDTPYTYHRISGHYGNPLAPTLPGLTVLGSSGSIDAFRWLYAYRVSLVAQKMMKGSLYSETARRFIPFVFYGVLVERDAEILLEMKNLSLLRYRGNLSPEIEYLYLLDKMNKLLGNTKFSLDQTLADAQSRLS